MAKRVGVRWTRRLLNTCMRQGKIRGVADGVDSPCMEKKGRYSRPWKILSHHVAESCSEDVREDSGWKDKEDSGE